VLGYIISKRFSWPKKVNNTLLLLLKKTATAYFLLKLATHLLPGNCHESGYGSTDRENVGGLRAAAGPPVTEPRNQGIRA